MEIFINVNIKMCTECTCICSNKIQKHYYDKIKCDKIIYVIKLHRSIYDEFIHGIKKIVEILHMVILYVINCMFCLN